MKRTERDATRIVRSWLEEGADALPDRVLDAVEGQLPGTPQRRAGWLARMFRVPNGNLVRFGFAAVAVIAATIVGMTLFPGTVGGPRTTPTPTTATETETLASGSFTVPFTEDSLTTVDIQATATGATRLGQGIGEWIVSGGMEVSNEDGRFSVGLECTRTTDNGMLLIGGSTTDSTHDAAPEGGRIAIVLQRAPIVLVPGPRPLRAALWFEDQPPALNCAAFLEGVPNDVATYLRQVTGDVELGP
jgi:hypothetical protein